MTCGAEVLLMPGTQTSLRDAKERYPLTYDDVFYAVHNQMAAQRHATKLDLAVLIAWKHVRNARWMRNLLTMEDATVREITASAMALELDDQGHIDALRG